MDREIIGDRCAESCRRAHEADPSDQRFGQFDRLLKPRIATAAGLANSVLAALSAGDLTAARAVARALVVFVDGLADGVSAEVG